MSCGECGTRKHFFLTRTQDFFFVPCLRQDGKEKNLLFLYQAKKLQSFLSKFCNICMENLVSDQLTISLKIVFFIPITCLLDILRRNSVLVTHKSERVTSHCWWPKIIPWSHLHFIVRFHLTDLNGLSYEWCGSVQLFTLAITAAKFTQTQSANNRWVITNILLYPVCFFEFINGFFTQTFACITWKNAVGLRCYAVTLLF